MYLEAAVHAEVIRDFEDLKMLKVWTPGWNARVERALGLVLQPFMVFLFVVRLALFGDVDRQRWAVC